LFSYDKLSARLAGRIRISIYQQLYHHFNKEETMLKAKQLGAVIAALTVLMIFSGAVLAETGGKININTATVDELVQLDRVGPKYAARIVEFRDQNGPFKAPEDIMQVAGIGSKTFEVNKDRIVVK
jgi:competence protein ComEA